MSDASFSDLLKITRYNFDDNIKASIADDIFVSNSWPLLYIISDDKLKEAYIGESTSALSRMENHLRNPDRKKLSDLYLITCDCFNKSATLHLESALISYLSGQENFQLQNGNAGLFNHNFYQKQDYVELFYRIWELLYSKKVAIETLRSIENSDFFKFSPYKSLTNDQYHSIQTILTNLIANPAKSQIVDGVAGTGKTVLAVFLIKLLKTKIEDLFDRENFEDSNELKLIIDLKAKFEDPKVALVVPMVNLRNTLKKVFKNIKGLKSGMVIGPSDVFKKDYDILLIDESHRLRRRLNLPNFGSFDINNQKLEIGNDGTELDWILQRSKYQIFFYDSAQSVRPSDVPKSRFDELSKTATTFKLHSQLRIKGGTDYIKFVHKLLNISFTARDPVFYGKEYEFFLFDSLSKLKERLNEKEKEYKLCRLVAGYSWAWPSKTDKAAIDISIEGIDMRWNVEYNDWINSPTAFEEVGCIHTTQGYDLNYAGVIFGKEISYDPKTNRIVIIPGNYRDRNGKAGIKDPEVLHSYIINIYKTLMYRGIWGTYVYVCDDNLREYFRKYIPVFEPALPFKISDLGGPKPKNSVPIFDDISAAAGVFSEEQAQSGYKWAELTEDLKARDEYFICKVVGESMNKVIPNGSWCLFEKDLGGSRNGKIVLAELLDRQDQDSGSRVTVKYYDSKKEVLSETWKHLKITLKPKSYSSEFNEIVLIDHEIEKLKVIGILVKVLGK